jgi:hypothetical protein
MGRIGRSEAFSARAFAIIMALVLSLGWPSETAAYAVLAHEAIIDSVWDTNIRPLLLKRFPGATAEEIKEAHGYAYGGAIIQDMGYYPHGSFFFSDLAHYVGAETSSWLFSAIPRTLMATRLRLGHSLITLQTITVTPSARIARSRSCIRS